MLKNKYTIILIVIIAVGFILRLVGFEFEYLFNSIGDETYHNSCILRMLENRTLSHDGCQSPYPVLYAFLYAPSIVAGLFSLALRHGFDLAILKQVIAVYPLSTLPFIRLFTIMVGTAQIFLIYKITQTLFNSQLKGLIAAGLMAFSLLPVQLSHWGRAWTLLLFFNLLSLYSAVWIYRTGRRKYYILNTVFTSSGIGVHYLAFFGAIFLFCGHFFRTLRLRSEQGLHFSFKEFFKNNKNLYLSLGLSLFLGALWLLLNRTGVHDMFLAQTFRGINIGQYLSTALIFFKNFAIFDPVVFLLFVAALLINFRKLLTFEYLFFTLFFVFYLAGMIFFNFGPRLRWTLPLIVIAIPVAADLLGDLKSKIKSSVVYAALIIILLLPALIFSATFDYILTLPNTRFAAKDWIGKNLPLDSKILFLDKTAILAVSQEGAKFLNTALAGARPPNPRFLYLAENGQRAFPGYQVVTLRQFLDNRSYFENLPFDYYVLSYSNEKEYQEQIAFFSNPGDLELVHQIMPFESATPLSVKKSFDPEAGAPLDNFKILKDIQMTGPSIEIYRAKNL